MEKSQALCKHNSEAVYAQIMSKRSSVGVGINIRDSIKGKFVRADLRIWHQ